MCCLGYMKLLVKISSCSKLKKSGLPTPQTSIGLDFFLWGYLIDKVYTLKPATLQDLKNAIHREIAKITPEMCESVVDNFKSVIIAQIGRHIEYMM